MKGLALGLLGFGLLLLILSGLWTSLFPGTAIWTDEKAARMAELRGRLHTLGLIVDNPSVSASMHSGPETGKAKEEYERLKLEREQLLVDFNSASENPRSVANALKWTGISLAALGIIGWYAVKQTSS